MKEKISLIDFISQQISKADHQLGDRSTYVGASDVGQCMRKSYLSKKEKVAYELKQLLVFERGHLGEFLFRQALQKSSIKFEEQVELVGSNGFDFIKAHIDFFCEDAKEVVLIEVKTVSLMPEQPYPSWVLQVQLQMWLAAQKNPDKKIRAKIVAWDANTGILKEWDQEPIQELANAALDRASELWAAIQNNQSPKGEVDHLCSYCPFKGSCEALREGASSLPADVGEAVQKLQKINKLKKLEKDLRATVVDYFRGAGIKKGTHEDTSVTLVDFSGRETIDVERLKSEKPEVFQEYLKIGEPYPYLRIA